MTEWRISNRAFTVWVKTKNGKIVDSAPVVRKFQGQHFKNFMKWMRGFGKTDKRKLFPKNVVKYILVA